MPEITITHHETFVTEECITCGVTFAMTQTYRGERLRDRRSYFCPNGHSQHYIAKTEAEIEREKAVRLQQQLDQMRAARDAVSKDLAREQKKASRLSRRIAAGVCPCCHRSFVKLARHMKTKHPEYAA